MTTIDETVMHLYEQAQVRESPDPATFARPHLISYGDGSSVIIERIPTHLPEACCDKIIINTAKGTYVLNDMVDVSLLFIDGGSGFEYNVEPRINRPADHFIFYGSVDMRLRSGLYALLHEFCHVTVNARGGYSSTAHLEDAVWDEADKLVVEMGLVLFENRAEQRLYRDIHVRTYDLHDEEGITYDSVVRDIHLNRFKIEVILGLIEASKQGEPLEDLCSTLLAEKEE